VIRLVRVRTGGAPLHVTRTARCTLARVVHRGPSYDGRSPKRTRAVRAAWKSQGGRCYSLAPASADPASAHPLSPGSPQGDWNHTRASLCGNASRRSGREPPALGRIRAAAGGAFTETVPTSGVFSSSSGTTASVPSRPAAAAACASVAHEAGFTRLTRIVPLAPSRSPAEARASKKLEERPKTPSVVPISCELPPTHTAFQPCRPSTLRYRSGSKPSSRTFDGADRGSHTVSLGSVLVHAPLRSPLPTGFPRERSAPPGARSFFWDPTALRVSDRDGYSELAPAAQGSPCGLPLAHERDAYDRRLLPTSSTHEYPRIARYRHLFEAYASPLTAGLHPRPKDRWTWRFTTPCSLRRTLRGWRLASFGRALLFEPYLWHRCRPAKAPPRAHARS